MRLALRPEPAALGPPPTHPARVVATAAFTARLHQPQSPPCRPWGQQQRHTPHRKLAGALRRRSATTVASASALLPLGLTVVQQDVLAALAAMGGALACVKSCDALADSGAVDRVREEEVWVRCTCCGAPFVSDGTPCECSAC